jgi:hypothetical protein
VARIDRRVSPNQTALWTVYEMVAIQAVRVARQIRSTMPQQNGDSRPAGVLGWLVGFVIQVLRVAVTRRDWSRLMCRLTRRAEQDPRAPRVPLTAVNGGIQRLNRGAAKIIKTR